MGYGLQLRPHDKSAKRDILIGHHAHQPSSPPTIPWSTFVRHSASAPKYTGTKLKSPVGKKILIFKNKIVTIVSLLILVLDKARKINNAKLDSFLKNLASAMYLYRNY